MCTNNQRGFGRQFLYWGVIVTAGIAAGHIQQTTANDDPVEQVVERYRRQYGDPHPGVVKIKGVVKSVAPVAEALESGWTARIATPKNLLGNELSAEIMPSNGISGASVRISLYQTANEAQDAPFKEFATYSVVPTDVMAKKGSEYDFGDRCLINVVVPPTGVTGVTSNRLVSRMFFSRNNVAVKIKNRPEQGMRSVDVVALARLIDDVLRSAISPSE